MMLAEQEFFTNRGRWSLKIALQALGIKPGDKVALQAFTCSAVPEAIMSVGAIPIFVDTTDFGLNMSIASLDDLNQRHEIAAVVFQFTLGSSESWDEVTSYCESKLIPIIEDRCHSSLFEKDNLPMRPIIKFRFYSYEWGKPHPIGLGGHLEVIDTQLIQSVTKIYEELKPLPFLEEIKVEAQYFVFSNLYNEKLHFLFKKMYNFLGKLGLITTNYNDFAKLGLGEGDCYKISKFVMKRFLRLTAHSQDMCAKIVSQTILNHPSYGKKFKMPRNTAEGYYRLPLLVSEKDKFIKLGQQSRVQIFSWYTSVVHPLPSKLIAELGWDTSHCNNANDLSRQFVSLPIKSDEDLHNVRLLLDTYANESKDFT